MKYRSFILFTLCLSLIGTRFINLDKTARFTRDESSDLVKIHQYWVDKTVTLVGPIDNTATLVYGSLTYYLLMPFAVIGNFTPVSTAAGTAFYSTVSGLVLFIALKKINPPLFLPAAVLVILFSPFLISGRWAWNPHLVPFWGSVAILCYLRHSRLSMFVSGFSLGLMFHHHYIAALSIAGFAIPVFLREAYKKRYFQTLVFSLGVFATLLPFVIFDLRHPPGLFFSHYLGNNVVKTGLDQSVFSYLEQLLKAFWFFLETISQQRIIAVAVGILLCGVIYLDIQKQKKNLMYLLPVVLQIAVLPLLPTFELRYVLPAMTFFFVWLFSKRTDAGLMFSKVLIALLIIGNASTFFTTITKTKTPPDMYSAQKITQFISEDILQNNLKNVNLTVLASTDREPLGVIYRDMLLMKNVPLLSSSIGEYQLTDNLYVISESDEQTVRSDPSNIIGPFKNGRVDSVYEVNQSNWKVYRFTKVANED